MRASLSLAALAKYAAIAGVTTVIFGVGDPWYCYYLPWLCAV